MKKKVCADLKKKNCFKILTLFDTPRENLINPRWLPKIQEAAAKLNLLTFSPHDL